MYKNLEAELTRYSLKQSDVANLLDITTSTANLKLNGKAPLTLKEAYLLKNYINELSKQNFTIEYLFEIEE